MKQIEKAMLNAIRERKNWHNSNTSVKIAQFGNLPACVVVRLHGNVIYFRNLENNAVFFTLAGWNTNTTRSRLNALGIGVYQRNFAPMYNGKEISSREWHNV